MALIIQKKAIDETTTSMAKTSDTIVQASKTRIQTFKQWPTQSRSIKRLLQKMTNQPVAKIARQSNQKANRKRPRRKINRFSTRQGPILKTDEKSIGEKLVDATEVQTDSQKNSRPKF